MKTAMTHTYRSIKATAFIVFVFAIVILFNPPATAQVFDTVSLFQETLSSDFFGVDARAMAMGNTGIVTARDGSGLIYNPANLARVRRIEFRGGLSHMRLTNKTEIQDRTLGVLSDGRRMNRTRINALSLTLPVPTYRGALVFAFGVHRVNNFDRAFGVTIPEPGLADFTTSRARETENGGLLKWSMGGAVDISPHLAAGLSLHLLSGRDEYGWNRVYANRDPAQTITLNDGIDTDYLGFGATAGLNYTVSRTITTGITVEAPTYLRAKELFEETIDTAFSSYEWFTNSYSDYSITKPFTFGFGISGTFDRLLLTGNLRYTDWSQLSFAYTGDVLPDNREDQFIQDNLKEALSLHIGGEFLFPSQGINLRAGYFRDPLPIDNVFIESQRQYVTVGAGFLIDRVMTLDIAYVHGGYKLRNNRPGSYFADYRTRRVFLTFAYRI